MRRFSFRDRWERSRQDTKGFHEWVRNLFLSFLAAVVTFFIQAERENFNEAMKGLWIAGGVFAATFVMWPVFEFVWNFARAPRRILEGENRELLGKYEEQVVVVSQLQAKLETKLNVKSLHITPTPTGGLGPCVYIQVLIGCATEAGLDNCQGHLIRVRKWIDNKKRWEDTQLDERLQLGWSIEASPHIHLDPRVPRRLNIFWILGSKQDFFLCVHDGSIPLRAQNVFNTVDTFRFDVVITADHSASVAVCLEASWGDKWDSPRVSLVENSTTPPVVYTRHLETG